MSWGSFFTPKTQEDVLKLRNRQLDKDFAEHKLKKQKLKSLRKKIRQIKFKQKMASMPAQINKVHIEGLGRTNDDIILPKIKPLFNVQNFNEIVLATNAVQKSLKQLGCFKKVDVYVDTPEDDGNNGDKKYEVTIDVEEIGPLHANVGSLAGPGVNELSAAARFGVNNVLGKGERVEVEYCKGSKSSKQLGCSFVRPLHHLGPGNNVCLSLNNGQLPLPHFSSTVTSSTLSSLASFTGLAGSLTSAFKASVEWSQHKHSFSTPKKGKEQRWHPSMEEAGHCLRTSLQSNVCLDWRDDSLFPTKGLYVKAQHLIANSHNTGLCNQLSLRLSAHHPITTHTSAGISLSAHHTVGQALLKELPNYFSPNMLRGFLPPKNWTGDDSNIAATASFSSRLPYLSNNSFISRNTRLHSFITGHSRPCVPSLRRGVWKEAWPPGQVVVGVGLVAKLHDLARLEINYCVPICFRKGDRPKQGLSLGIGVDFL